MAAGFDCESEAYEKFEWIKVLKNKNNMSEKISGWEATEQTVSATVIVTGKAAKRWRKLRNP